MLLQRKNDIAIGDYVRISVHKKTFDKRGYANFTEEVFQVKEKVDSVPYYYKLADLTGETVTGKFYREELLKTTPSMRNYRKSEPKYVIDKLVKPVSYTKQDTLLSTQMEGIQRHLRRTKSDTNGGCTSAGGGL
jgi:hypothetical protein